MLTEAQNERKELNRLIAALRRFNQFDTKMQVSTILTLLEVAAADRASADISVQDVENRVGLHSSTASRNVYYWGEGHKDMRGGHEMVDIGFDPSDRRKRTLRMTPKGKAFVNSLLGEYRNG